ncbi:MAG: xanthine dehydrogenase molybdopterin binding subunit, partial [Tepidisphaeraceae bacterium]
MRHVVGKDIPHDSAAGHVSGESQFLDDVAPLAGELLAGIVPCPVAHGRLTHLDVAPALLVPGVKAALTHRDIPGHNQFGPV